jgi:hypothetical protein
MFTIPGIIEIIAERKFDLLHISLYTFGPQSDKESKRNRTAAVTSSIITFEMVTIDRHVVWKI